MMLVNNETGTILPVKKVFTEIKRRFPDIITHCDAVQAFMKIPVKANDLKADLISMSAHKIYGPKGVGALYVKKGVRLLKQNLGGKQENNMRGGTEAVPLIAGFGEAVLQLKDNFAERTEKLETLRKYFTEKISTMDGIVLNSSEDAVPYIVNISVKGIRFSHENTTEEIDEFINALEEAQKRLKR